MKSQLKKMDTEKQLKKEERFKVPEVAMLQLRMLLENREKTAKAFQEAKESMEKSNQAVNSIVQTISAFVPDMPKDKNLDFDFESNEFIFR